MRKIKKYSFKVTDVPPEESEPYVELSNIQARSLGYFVPKGMSKRIPLSEAEKHTSMGLMFLDGSQHETQKEGDAEDDAETILSAERDRTEVIYYKPV